MAYEVFETEQFQKDLGGIDPVLQQRLKDKLRGYVYPALAQSPRYGPNIKRLRAFEPPTWRYRIGNWRFFYAVDDAREIVFMLGAEPRDRAYR